MSSYFSGTDVATLKEKGENVNHFVSLIVNNAGNYVARVTKKIIKESHIEAHIKYVDNTYYNTFDGEKVTLEENKEREETKSRNKKEERVEWYDFNITKEHVQNDFNELDSRISEIKRNKNKSTYTSKYYGYDRKYPTLFQESDYNYPNYNYTKQKEYYSDYPKYSDYSKYDTKDYPSKDLILEPSTYNKIAIQLITGSIIPRQFNKEQLDNWVKVMDVKWEDAIGPFIEERHPALDKKTLESNDKRLSFWIETMVEILIYEEDRELTLNLHKEFPNSEITEDDVAAIKAGETLEFLNKLGNSYVLNKIIECLNNYL